MYASLASRAATYLVSKCFMDTLVKVDHPITTLNPVNPFKVIDAKADALNVYVRGEDSMWFGLGLVQHSDPRILHYTIEYNPGLRRVVGSASPTLYTKVMTEVSNITGKVELLGIDESTCSLVFSNPEDIYELFSGFLSRIPSVHIESLSIGYTSMDGSVHPDDVDKLNQDGVSLIDELISLWEICKTPGKPNYIRIPNDDNILGRAAMLKSLSSCDIYSPSDPYRNWWVAK